MGSVAATTQGIQPWVSPLLRGRIGAREKPRKVLLHDANLYRNGTLLFDQVQLTVRLTIWHRVRHGFLPIFTLSTMPRWPADSLRWPIPRGDRRTGPSSAAECFEELERVIRSLCSWKSGFLTRSVPS